MGRSIVDKAAAIKMGKDAVHSAYADYEDSYVPRNFGKPVNGLDPQESHEKYVGALAATSAAEDEYKRHKQKIDSRVNRVLATDNARGHKNLADKESKRHG